MKAFIEKHPGAFWYQLGDLLWAYALEITLVLSTGNLRKALLHGIVITIAAEFFQLLPVVYATFDILDIVAQVVGVALASIVSRWFYNLFHITDL